MKAVRAKLPYEDIVYVGDCQNAPYGDRTEEFITNRVRTISQYFLSRKAKAIVIACNTATATSIDQIRKEIDIPFIGVEPAVKPAIALTKAGTIGVMATTGTVNSQRYKQLVERHNPGSKVNVVSVACSGLMECVERGEWDTPNTNSIIKDFVSPMKAQGADIVVLGCTHYPFLSDVIQKIVGKDILLYDPSPAIAEELKNQLLKRSWETKENTPGTEEFLITGLTDENRRVIELLWGNQVKINSIDL